MPVRPRLPWGTKPRKPGSGLHQLFPSKTPPPPDEPITSKMPVVPEAAGPGDRLCPVCGGGGELHLNAYQREPDPTCGGSGVVTKEVFDKYIAEHPHCLAARQLAAKNKPSP